MTQREAEKLLEEIVIGNACVEVENLTGKRFLEDLQYDSLSIVQLMVDIEEAFGIQMNNMEAFIEHLDTFEDFMSWILKELEVTYGKIDGLG